MVTKIIRKETEMKPKTLQIIIGIVLLVAIGAVIAVTANKSPEPAKASGGHDHSHGEAMTSTCPLTGSCSAGKNKAHAEESTGNISAFNKMNFTLENHLGQEVTLADFAGKIVVLEWFNHECPFVKPHYEKGTFKNLAEKWDDQGVVWLAINSTHHVPASADAQWVEKFDLPYPILNDRSGKVGHMFEATNTPHMFIIHKNGQIVYEGPVDNAHRGKAPDGEYIPYLDNALKEITQGREVTTPYVKPVGCTVKYAG